MLKKLIQYREFQKKPLDFIHSAQPCSSEPFTLSLPFARLHFLYSPASAGRVLLQKQSLYGRCALVFDRIVPLTGRKGLVQLQSQKWAALRRHYAALFLPSALEKCEVSMSQRATELIKTHANSQLRINIVDLASEYVMSNALEIFVAKEGGNAKHLAKTFLRLNEIYGKKMLQVIAWPSFRGFLVRLRLSFAIRHFLGNSPLQNSKAPRHSGILRDQIKTFLFAGHETTTSSLVSAVYLLAKHPQYQRRFRDLDKDERTAFLKNVYLEALRLYPPAWILVRTARADDLELKVRKGDHLIVAVREIHRNPNYWIAPDTFDPDRHSLPYKNPFQFIPYGAGPKKCIGAALAPLEATLFLEVLLNAYKISSRDDLEMQANVTLFPKGKVFINLERLK